VTKTRLVAVLAIGAGIALCRTSTALADPDYCTFAVVSGISFGNYNVLSALPTQSNGTISYSCALFPPAGEVVNIQLSTGSAPTFNPRYMVNGAQHLNYNVYLDAGLTKIWGNGTGGSSQYGAVTLNGVLTTLTVYGNIPAGQDVGAGAYTDTLTVTMLW